MPHPLTGVLRTSSLHVLLIVVSKVLSRSGFGDVQILGRRQERQKSKFGGHEVQCLTQLGNLPAKVLVKVVRDTVRLRAVDELAGAVARTGSDRGLIVSAYGVCQSAEEALLNPALKVDVLSGDGLADLMVKFGFGVRPSGQPDYAYFGQLEEVSPKILGFMKENS